MAIGLISLDVGGTLGFKEGWVISDYLAVASKLPASQIRDILRSTLYTAPKITESLIEKICKTLDIDYSCFPTNYIAPSLQIYPWAVAAVKSLSLCAPVVTLSNVCCLEFEGREVELSFGPYIHAQYPSCELGYSKPAPQAFVAVAERHRVSTGAIMHIGDDWECDVLGALAVGAQSIWISRGRLAPADQLQMYSDRLSVVRDLSEAPDLLCSLNLH